MRALTGMTHTYGRVSTATTYDNLLQRASTCNCSSLAHLVDASAQMTILCGYVGGERKIHMNNEETRVVQKITFIVRPAWHVPEHQNCSSSRWASCECLVRRLYWFPAQSFGGGSVYTILDQTVEDSIFFLMTFAYLSLKWFVSPSSDGLVKSALHKR